MEKLLAYIDVALEQMAFLILAEGAKLEIEN